MKKRFLSFILTFAMICAFVPCVYGATIIDSGTCGDNVTWTLDDNGTLTISGSGNMEDYDFSDVISPWYFNRKSITDAIIENGVTRIGESTFEKCINLATITIPNSVTSISEWAFYDCSGLTSIEIPNSVTSIGEGAFSACSSLTSIEIPNSVTSIDSWAFDGCTGLTSIEIPSSVTSIGERTFSACNSLTNITIPNSVKSIDARAFWECSSLTNIEIPNSVTSIGSSAFKDCTALTNVYYNGSEEEWKMISIDSGNDELTSATIHYNSTGSTNNSAVSASTSVSSKPNSYNSFTDVPQSHWAYDIIEELTSDGIISGMGDGTFEPEGSVTREQFMKLLVCALDCETDNEHGSLLSDVDSDDWSAPYIFAGIERGIYSISDSGDTFYPTDNLKRGISAEWIVDGLGVDTESENKFSDVSGNGSQSKAIAVAAKLGIVSGYEDNTFRANNTITRAEAAALIQRLMNYQEEYYSLREDAENEIELQDEVEMVESDDDVNIPIKVDESDKTVTFSNADETIKSLDKGDILFIQPCDNFSNGLLGKVVSVSGSKNVTVELEEPELTEVVKSVDISTYVYADADDFLDDGDLSLTSAVKGVSTGENGLNIDGNADAGADISISWGGVQVDAYANANEKATVHFETESYAKKEGIYAAVDMSMGVKVDIQLETDNFDIEKFEASADLVTDISAVGGYSNSVSKEYSYELPQCDIPVAGLFNITIDSNLVLSADGSLNIEATADFDNDIGMKFSIDDGFTTHNTTEASTELSVDAEGSLKIGPKEELKLTFCGVSVMGHTFFEGVSLLEADASFGIGATGKVTIDKSVTVSDDGISYGDDGELKHLCYFCIQGDIIKYFNGNVGVGSDIQDLISKICDKQLTYNFADIEDKISDWHLSTGDGYTLEFGLCECPHYEEIQSEETQSDEDSLLTAFTNQVGNDYLYFLPADYDDDGTIEAFGITGDDGDISTNVDIWFINSDGKCTLAKSDTYGVLKETITVSNGSFITWCVTTGGSSSSALVYGCKDGELYEPSVSGQYAGFGDRTMSYIFSDVNDFEELNCDYIGYNSYFKDGGGHVWDPIAFEYDAGTREFVEANNYAETTIFERSSSDDNKTFEVTANGRNIYKNSTGIYVDGQLIDSNAHWAFISDGYTLYYSYNGNVYRVNLDTLEKEYVLYCEDVFLCGCYNNQYLYYETGQYNDDEIQFDLVIYDLANNMEIALVDNSGDVAVGDNFLFVLAPSGDMYPVGVRQMNLDGSNCKTVIDNAAPNDMKVIGDELYYGAMFDYSGGRYKLRIQSYNAYSGKITVLTEYYNNGMISKLTETYASIISYESGSPETFDVYYGFG